MSRPHLGDHAVNADGPAAGRRAGASQRVPHPGKEGQDHCENRERRLPVERAQLHHRTDTIPDLATAIAQNPALKVLAVNGYHDVATPFHTTELDLARLGANPNVTVRNYMGGHMTYLDDASRVRMKADLAAWYRSALGN